MIIIRGNIVLMVFEHERNTMKLTECCVGLGLCSLWMRTCVMDDKSVKLLIES